MNKYITDLSIKIFDSDYSYNHSTYLILHMHEIVEAEDQDKAFLYLKIKVNEFLTKLNTIKYYELSENYCDLA